MILNKSELSFKLIVARPFGDLAFFRITSLKTVLFEDSHLAQSCKAHDARKAHPAK
jgi:hypothetical protein